MASQTATSVVSVIVPARNEESCLASCLDSLVSQSGIPFEVIVVDDASTDSTAEIARSLPGVKVIAAPPLPENWTGKNNAMAAGAKIATGKWLLFTDADTVHKPGSLARAVAEAEHEEVALLSYSPEQEVRTFLEKAVMPVIFAELASKYPPSKVRDPNSPVAAANGQYLMISREAYDAVGGYAKVASDLLEDVAMARLVKSSGRKIWFRYGGDAVRTRMYRSWSQMKEGWTKNLALLFPKASELGWIRIWQSLFIVVSPWSLLRGSYWKPFLNVLNPPLVRWQSLLMGVLCSVLFIWWSVEYVVRMRRSRAKWPSVAFGLVGLPLFGYLLFRSQGAYKNARFDWKDRSYVYTEYELENLTQASSEPELPFWRRVLNWVRRPPVVSAK
jgi:glycosyltransferase involved in cell wall biosynthesis